MAVDGHEVIDLHAHIVLEDAFGHAGRYGPTLTDDDSGRPAFRVGTYELKPMPYRGSLFMDVEKRLAVMADIGIDRQMLSPNPLTFFGGVESEAATGFARVTNEAMAATVAADPDRLIGSAQIPLQDVAAAQRELDRAAAAGLVAAYIGTDYGIALDDVRLDPFYRQLVELDLPLFIHPATNDGRSPAADQRLHRFGLDLIVGYTYEETLTVATLVLGGVFDRHPDLDVCISHGGGAIAYLVERFDSMARFRRQPADFGDQLRHLWFDAHMEPGPARQLLVDLVGAERMVYGTNLGGWDTPAAADAFDASLSANARRLLRQTATEEGRTSP